MDIVPPPRKGAMLAAIFVNPRFGQILIICYFTMRAGDQAKPEHNFVSNLEQSLFMFYLIMTAYLTVSW